MRARSRSPMFVLVLAAALCAPMESAATGDPRFTVLEEDESGFTLHVEVPEPEADSIDTVAGAFGRVTLPGAGSLADPGVPDVPVLRPLVQLPEGAIPELTVVDAETETWAMDELGIDGEWMPVQPPTPKRPGAREAREFRRQDAIYAQDAPYPGSWARLGDEVQQRGHRFVALELFPVQPNPAAGTVELARALTVRVDFHGADWGRTEARLRRYMSRDFDARASQPVVNRGAFPAPIEDDGPTGYLIVAHPDLLEATLPFAELKRRQGHEVTLASTADIGGARETIRGYIQRQYEEAEVPPSFVLLVGDTDLIPHFVGPLTGAATDLYYGTMDGPDDLHPDLRVGRFPARTPEQTELLVQKNLEYQELSPDDDNDWIRRASFLASQDEYRTTEGAHDYCIDRWLEPQDFSCSRRYVTEGATTEGVRRDIDAGLSQLTFSGHGWVWGWLDGPSLNIADLLTLDNAGMLPVVQSYACETGMYELDSFIEQWVLVPDGAIASWGSSTSSYFDEDDVLERAVYDAWFLGQARSVRGALDRGTWAVWTHWGGGGVSADYREQYNLMGDPSLQVWFAPPEPAEVVEGFVADEVSDCECSTASGESRGLVWLPAGLLALAVTWRRRRSLRIAPPLIAAIVLLPSGCDRSVEVEAGDLEDAVADVVADVHADIGSVVVVTWEQMEAHPGWVEYSFDDGDWWSSPRRDLAAGSQRELLLGIPYGTDVSLRLVNELEDSPLTSDQVSITTDSQPAGIPTATVVTAEPALWDPDRPYLLAGAEDWTVILDRAGRVVWGKKTPAFRITMHPQVSVDGTDLLIDHGSFWAIFDSGNGSKVVRLKIDGTEVETYATKGLHHPFTELGDGSIVWSTMSGDDETIQRLRPDGQQVQIASCADLLGGFGDKGYCGSNTLRWYEQDDTLLYSLYSHETILEVDIETGQALRLFGHHHGAWSFDPPGSAFWWQHGGHYTSAGTLLTSSYRAQDDTELVVREYELDPDQQILREIWSFGVGKGIEGEYMGEAHRLPGGNTLHNYGSNPRLREVQPDGTVVWDVVWEGGGGWELGRTTPLSDLYAFAP